MPSAFDDVMGQPAAVESLRRALRGGRLASAYLFDGPSGVGKGLTALALAKESIAAGDSALTRRIDEGAHPDVRVFGPRDEGDRNIQVEFLRSEILPVTQFAPFEATRAFILFPEADVSFPESHPESANALLKTLEEPRPGVTFVLLSERPDYLLPTIRSRCQRIRFKRLSPLTIERILESRGASAKARNAAAALSDGRADRALLLAEEGRAEAMFDAAARLDEALDHNRPGTLADVAEALTKSDSLSIALETLTTYYRDVACAGLGLAPEALSFRHWSKQIGERARVLSPARAAARAELITGLRESFERNANPLIAMDSLVHRLRNA